MSVSVLPWVNCKLSIYYKSIINRSFIQKFPCWRPFSMYLFKWNDKLHCLYHKQCIFLPNYILIVFEQFVCIPSKGLYGYFKHKPCNLYLLSPFQMFLIVDYLNNLNCIVLYCYLILKTKNRESNLITIESNFELC